MFNLAQLGFIQCSHEHQTKAPEEKIIALEKYYGHPLPDLYKEILKKYNGCGLSRRFFASTIDYKNTFSLCEIEHFFFIDNTNSSWLDIFQANERYKEDLGPDSFAFAQGHRQDVFCFKWVNEENQVWQLNYLDDEDLLADKPFLVPLTHNFVEMLAACSDDMDEIF